MIRDLIRALSPLAWAVIAGVVLVIVLLTLSYCTARGRDAREAVEAKVAGAFADASAGAAGDAVDAVTNNAASADQIDQDVKDSEDAIRNADPDDRDDVTVRELCNRPDGHRRPGC